MAVSDSALLGHISRSAQHRASYKQLVRELGAKGWKRDDLESALARLERRGDLIEWRKGHYVVARLSREYAAGVLRVHRDGYGFVIPERRRDDLKGDLFVPSDEAGKAMHGDRVLARIGRIQSDGKAEAEIVRVLRRAHATVVGEFVQGKRYNYVKPHDERLNQWIEIPAGLEIPDPKEMVDRVGAKPVTVRDARELDGAIVNVEILEFPEDGEHAVGRVIEILGREGDFGLDVEIIIRKHHLPAHFDDDVIAQARAIPAGVDPGTRRDFRDFDIVTIDGETARDFDDAVWVDRLPNGRWALQVHIADVSHYVLPGSPIDEEAQKRGTSVYFPDRAVPMLPLELSTDLCSLRPGVDRYVLSALLELDGQGDIVRQEFCEGVIRSRERMTYTAVHALLEGDPEQRERYAPLVDRFEMMRELALILNRKRQKRGSIDFDLPEPLIEFDEFGEMTGVTRSPRNIAHRIIEEFMLAANESVAGHLENAGVPAVYRIHETPDPKKVIDFEEIAKGFGFSLGVAGAVKKYSPVMRTRDGRKLRRDKYLADPDVRITSRHYQKLIAAIEGQPEERILSYLMLRSLKQARYSEGNTGHFALAAPVYTHFTSPIRRYPDLMVHRILRRLLRGQEPAWTEDALAAIADDCSFTERRAAEAERELVEWKKAKFMVDHVGEEFRGLIISVTRFGFFVELDRYFIEGLVPIESLRGDRFTWQENTRTIVGERSRRAYAIGDKVKVLVDRVDASEGRVQLSLTP